MKKEFIKIALATTLVTSAFTVTPIAKNTDTIFMHTVQASSVKDIEDSSRHWDVFTLSSLEHTVYSRGYDKAEAKLNLSSLKTFGNIKVNGKLYSNGDDITNIIANCTSIDNYKNRKVMGYDIGLNDLIRFDDNLEGYVKDVFDERFILRSKESTTFTFTAPFTGEFRLRADSKSNMAIQVIDKEYNMVLGRDPYGVCLGGGAVLRDGLNVEIADWYTVNIVKGRKYLLKMYADGSTENTSLDMLFMRRFTSGKTYKENTWNIYTSSNKYREAILTEKYDTETRERVRDSEGLIKVKLDKQSDITLKLRDLIAIDNEKNVVPTIEIYKKDSKSKTGYTIYKKFNYTIKDKIEVARKTGVYKFRLPKGTFYVKVLTNDDFAFKYTIEK